MTTQILSTRSLLPNGSAQQLTIERDQEVGAGGQGSVYPVVNSDLLVKLYPDRAAKEHVLHMVDHLHRHRIPEQCSSLRGLPCDVFESSAGEIGILMGRVPGENLTHLGYAPLRQLSLRRRLELGCELAQGAAFLHACGVVLADLAEPNTMVDLDHNHAYLIDVEGGGLYVRDGYQLKPLVWGHDQGSLMAPELRDRRQLPSFASDAWSLAGLLHRFLSRPAGADAFFFGTDPRVLTSDLPWPPPAEQQPEAMRPLLVRHRHGLAHLGPRLLHHFQSTFGPMGRQHPEHRTSTLHWLRDLSVARHWLHRCGQCGQEFVAEQLSHCPACTALIPHARLVGDRRTLPLLREGVIVTRYQLGLGTDRQPMLRWHRYGHDLVVEALDDGCALATTLSFRPLLAQHSYRLPPGAYRLRIGDKMGGTLTLRLFHPRGPWMADKTTGEEATA